MISPSNWEQIQALFQSALERAPEERGAFLRARTSDDEILREVSSLLAAHEDADALQGAAGRHEAETSGSAPPKELAAKHMAIQRCSAISSPVWRWSSARSARQKSPDMAAAMRVAASWSRQRPKTGWRH